MTLRTEFRRRRPQAVLLFSLIVLFTSGIGAAMYVGGRPGEAAAEAAVVVRAPVPTTSPTTAPVPTTVAPSTTQGPIAVPDDPYAPEDVVLLGKITIPKIGLAVDLYHGITLRNIDHGPSHWPGSTMPGAIGNAVIAGHRVTHTHPFRNIDKLAPGDEIVFDIAGVRSVYRVTGTEVVSPSETRIALPTADAEVTLFACHPPGSARQRYVVHGVLVSTSATTSTATGAPPFPKLGQIPAISARF